MRSLILVIISISSIHSQTITNHESLIAFAIKKQVEYLKNRKEVEEYSILNNIPIYQVLDSGIEIEMQKIQNGKPIYFATNSLGAAQTTRTDELWFGGSLGLNVTGDAYNKIGEWDGGGVLRTHQELTGRITQVDVPSTTLSNHATHVAGILVASGVDADVKGMAFESLLDAYDWNSDESEMATAASGGMEVSNHSYGIVSGWANYDHDGAGPLPTSMHWFGANIVDQYKDFWFGFYGDGASDWDQIAYDAPYYLIVKAAGNDRNDNYTGEHYHWNYNSNRWVLSSDSHDPDGNYDCILTKGVAKNILTVGAVYEVPNYIVPEDVVMSTFSGWGPADDGRVKPDIVGKGVSVKSSLASSNSAYASWGGTSMSSPNISGSLALLQQHYQNTHSSSIMRSATLKGLAIHTAEEAGPDEGPDYMFGWGLLNAERAANLITYNSYGNNVIDEQVLTDMASLGAAVVTKEKVEEATQRWVEEGKISREEAERLAQDLVESGKHQWEDIQEKMTETVRKGLDTFDIGSKKEFRELKARVDTLEKKIAECEEASGKEKE